MLIFAAPVVPPCLSVLTPLRGGAHCGAALPAVCSPLERDPRAHFLRWAHQETSSSPNLKIYEKLISLSLLYSHQQNPPTPVVCFEIREKALIVPSYSLAGTPTSRSRTLQTGACSVPGLGKVPVPPGHGTTCRKPHRSRRYVNLPA